MTVAENHRQTLDDLDEPLQLILYQKDTCPYCRRVLAKASALGIELELRSTWEPEHRERLMQIGGKRQVPCLVVNGRPMFESSDIIAFLESVAQRAA